MPEPLNIRDQIAISVTLAEGQFREFKSAYEGRPGDKKKRQLKKISKDIGETLVAFANADGGELIVGVEDDGALTGIDTFNSTEIDQIKQAPVSHVHADTPLQSVLCRTVEVEGKSVLYFRVSKGTRQIHLTSDGRCLKRNDLESIPVPAEQIQFDRREVLSREYDREFIDGATVADLDRNLIEIVAEQISPGISVDRCLQYLGLAVYEGTAGLRLRRAALLLFAEDPGQWHPRIQVRILKINGIKLGSGSAYNVSSDTTINANILTLIDEAWEGMRPYLVETKFQDDARFRAMFLYPEIACREALVNAVAHRDYSDEGSGIEIYIFDDRIEVKNPGSLLSSLSLSDIISLHGTHQSRNSYISRTLREVGIMRELGEGMRRIFEVMKSNELAQPKVFSDANSFGLTLFHRPMYTKEEIVWLDQYKSLDLSSEEKAVLLLGRRGDLIAPNDVIRRVGIVDIEHYRQIINSLQKRGILETTISKAKVSNVARQKGVGRRDIGRFRVKNFSEVKVKRQQKSNKGFEKQPRTNFNDELAIFVGNIPPNTSDRDLVQAFFSYGQAETVMIPKTEGLSRGYAFIEFGEETELQSALSAEIELGGRRLTIRRKYPRKKRVGRG